MKHICLEVEIMPGTSIEEAIMEAKDKAERWDIAYVKFNFNGIRFSIGRCADVQEVITKWEHINKNNISEHIIGA